MLNLGTFSRRLFDSELNWEQQKAIDGIVSRNYGTLPYLISGLLGTGKTKTLTEATLQFLQCGNRQTRILLCAPSDQRRVILRCQTLSYHTAAPRQTITSDSQAFELLSYKTVVTTCRDPILLTNARMTNTTLCSLDPGSSHYWTVLLVDEASQAMEPEPLIPISVVPLPRECDEGQYGPPPLVVMAGDEHQLGPRTALPHTPLKTSLFARLSQSPAEADHPLSGSGRQSLPPLSKSMLPILRPAFDTLIPKLPPPFCHPCRAILPLLL
ncbi:putative RNA helicase [Seiridium unicorne]|uniref:RNA helicase n=1 Tax=Seiridium unicorne TaxID=138068 RepID=A0ABR2UWF6_9PEZI